MDDFKGIKEAVKSAKRITILTQSNLNRDISGAVLALFFSLKNIDKIVNIPFLPKAPESIFSFKERSPQKTFLISFKKNISEVYYEKKGEKVNLYIAPKEGEISLEDFSFKTVPFSQGQTLPSAEDQEAPADLLIALGLENFQDVEKAAEKNPELSLPQIKIINIGRSGLNQKYADFNLVKKDNSLSRICAYFLKNLGLVNEKSASSLLYGFLDGAKEDSYQRSLPFLSWLAKEKADFSLWTDNEYRELLSEIFKKMEISENGSFFSVSLAEKDFEKTKTSPKSLGAVIKEIKDAVNVPSFLFLWEERGQSSPKKIAGVFYSENEDIVEKSEKELKGKRRGKGVLFTSPVADLGQAKKEILNIISRQS
ncbi:MAG: hypothetical protein PHR31_01725 [Candidatus Pacebacteria bacterium]|nr:hypothetical protein [Candidatus Paceibacterota bacterium]MDD4830839.1 hypothetical protein [Candidatus Paceibacterota bacterium]